MKNLNVLKNLYKYCLFQKHVIYTISMKIQCTLFFDKECCRKCMKMLENHKVLNYFKTRQSCLLFTSEWTKIGNTSSHILLHNWYTFLKPSGLKQVVKESTHCNLFLLHPGSISFGSDRKTTTLLRYNEYFISTKFHENPSSGSEQDVENVYCLRTMKGLTVGRTDERTDGQMDWLTTDERRTPDLLPHVH